MLLLLSMPLGARAETVYDTTQTVVIANTEVTAMAGAGISFVSGANGMSLNPAALAYRPHGRSAPASLSVKLAQHHLHATQPAQPTSLFSPARDGTFTEGGLGAVTDLGSVGIVGGRLSEGDGADTRLTLDEWHLGIARSFVDDHVLLGVGSRLLALTVSSTPAADVGSADGARLQGGGLEAGLILADIGHGFNVGLTGRSPVRALTRPPASDAAAVDPSAASASAAVALSAATGAVAPWQLIAGASWASRSAHLAGWPAVRFAADVLLDGPVAGGVALPAGASTALAPSGATTTLSPRLAGEVEALPDRLRLRAGTYLEPSRTERGAPRLHGTGGLELRLFRLRALGFVDLDVSWRVATDLAPGYTHVSWLGIGAWQRPILALGRDSGTGDTGDEAAPRSSEDTRIPSP